MRAVDNATGYEKQVGESVMPVGNIRDGQPLSELWNAHTTQRRRYEVHTCTRSCNLLNCNFSGAG